MDYELTEEQLETKNRIEKLSESLKGLLVEHIPDCKERDRALSRLEECVMWGDKGIVSNKWFYDLHEGFKKNKF